MGQGSRCAFPRLTRAPRRSQSLTGQALRRSHPLSASQIRSRSVRSPLATHSPPSRELIRRRLARDPVDHGRDVVGTGRWHSFSRQSTSPPVTVPLCSPSPQAVTAVPSRRVRLSTDPRPSCRSKTTVFRCATASGAMLTGVAPLVCASLLPVGPPRICRPATLFFLVGLSGRGRLGVPVLGLSCWVGGRWLPRCVVPWSCG
jgi:hypothetical protein